MGHLYIPAQKTITGPWLLDRKEIEELDEIFEFVDSKISESIDRDNVEEAREDVKREYSKSFEDAKKAIVKRRGEHHKRVTLISYDEKILFDSTVSGLLKDPKLVGFKAREIQFAIHDEFYRNDFKLDIKNQFDGELDYRVKCSHQEIEDDIK